MAKGLDSSKIDSGIIISTKKVNLKNKKIKIIIGTHPMPTKKNIAATKQTEKMINIYQSSTNIWETYQNSREDLLTMIDLQAKADEEMKNLPWPFNNIYN